VKIGVFELCPRRPDLIVSGINGGLNAGINVLYSGTVAAAIEGSLQGTPAIAASWAGKLAPDWTDPAAFLARLVARLLERGLPRRHLLNVNFPARPWADVRGVRVTRLGSRIYHDTLVKKVDPRGRDYYWIGGEDPEWESIVGTDFHAVNQGWVSVTPMRLDLTADGALAELEAWELEK
jgi:5'-nucleotidase